MKLPWRKKDTMSDVEGTPVNEDVDSPEEPLDHPEHEDAEESDDDVSG